MEKDYLQDVRPEAGRFRSFLLASLKHFLYNEWDRQKAQKRGGHLRRNSLDSQRAENRCMSIPPENNRSGYSWFRALERFPLGPQRQVKLRGHRIELNDVEARINKYPPVSSSVCRVVRRNENDQRLIAYFVGKGGIDPSLLENGVLSIFLLRWCPLHSFRLLRFQ